MEPVHLTINDCKVTVPPGTTILEAAQQIGIRIPTLCYLKEINAIGACRVCVVEVAGAKTLQAACVTPVAENMAVYTNNSRVRDARRTVVELILSNHPEDCLTCVRNQNCELQNLAAELGLRQIHYQGAKTSFLPDTSTAAIVRDANKCILCRRCQSVCRQIQGVAALAPMDRGFYSSIAPALHQPLSNVACTLCGQCVTVCPTGALTEKDSTQDVWTALSDRRKHVVVQVAPAVRVSIGEPFGLEPGTVATGKLVAALRRLGFAKVFDTDFTADLTILEEGSELIDRIQKGGVLPMITSCSPGWIKYVEHFYPEYLPHLSTCKSPQQMFGALAKTYYAKKYGLSAEEIYVVSVMPCTAKKFEMGRPEMAAGGCRDVDAVLTTRELGRMLKECGINLPELPEEEYDLPFGIASGAGVLFGASGGVMEAALRTVYEIITEQELPTLEFEAVRGLQGIKEATVDLAGTRLNVAVANGLANAKILMDQLRTGPSQYHFIEVMCCPGGCLGGGGQPLPNTAETRQKRMAGIYTADAQMPLRKSHENPVVKQLYAEFLGYPLGHRSHRLLHTQYTPRSKTIEK
ncbi:respiratory-chain nadh dehydrogenase 75 kd subunit signature 1 [Lucifera butyrica]|uniref:Respiratory-chain nadh dehydrogenase 75 kd subunit signature 1 n=1 Tax=Lucifera butyrica TaxID=1351585 RepID=A0A498RHV7_9FIRM|nr:NADH-dependent [FeFe] hydrogenase, group A6 [Lucifera butyrica]VBB09693.1 respiratory-chain nadh dehydrogenase 75 kd subunit signature 1 [Lucifera butyrica]